MLLTLFSKPFLPSFPEKNCHVSSSYEKSVTQQVFNQIRTRAKPVDEAHSKTFPPLPVPPSTFPNCNEHM